MDHGPRRPRGTLAPSDTAVSQAAPSPWSASAGGPRRRGRCLPGCRGVAAGARASGTSRAANTHVPAFVVLDHRRPLRRHGEALSVTPGPLLAKATAEFGNTLAALNTASAAFAMALDTPAQEALADDRVARAAELDQPADDRDALMNGGDSSTKTNRARTCSTAKRAMWGLRRSSNTHGVAAQLREWPGLRTSKHVKPPASRTA